jgi:hypothetical protein
MEASEKLTTHEGATVRTLDDRLVIERLEVEDERAARLVRERAEAGQPPADTVRGAIEIGARVLEREGTAAEVDYVKAEFSRHTGELAEKMVKLIESGNGLLAEEIAKSFGAERQGTVQQQIKEMLDRTAEGQREALARQFSAKDGSNPLFDFKDAVIRNLEAAEAQRQQDGEASRKRIEALTREIVELKERDQADQRVAEAEEAGTRKGRSFEERVHATIESVAAVRGDAAHHTGSVNAEAGGKKGDTVVELGAGEGAPLARLVFEAKTDRGLTRPEAWRELNGAMDKRDAGYAVMVVAGDACVPSNTQAWLEYEGNKMIVTVDAEEPERLVLEAVYAIARSRVLARADAALKVDAVGVREAVEEALSELRCVSTIKKHLTGVTNSADNARSSLVGMEEKLKALLSQIDGLVAVVDE